MKAKARPTFIEIEERLSVVLKELKEAEVERKKLVLEEILEKASNNCRSTRTTGTVGCTCTSCGFIFLP